MKMKKLPSAYVFGDWNRLGRRMNIPFAPEAWYDHEQASKYKFHVMQTRKKFLQGPEVTVVTLWNPLLEINWRGKTTIWE